MLLIAIASSITTGRFTIASKRQDADVRLVDDRHARDRPVRTGVRDGERGPLHLVGLELVRPGAGREVGDGPRDADLFILSAPLITGTMSPSS